MPHLAFFTRIALPALALGVLLLAAPALQAQDANERVIRSWSDEVKLESGSTDTYLFTDTFNTITGEYTRTVTNLRGEIIEQTVREGSLQRPNDEEVRLAREAILAHPEIAPLVADAANPTLSGGFVLLREEGHPCGPGSRCLQFDLYDVNDAAREVNRIRYLIVDARDFSVIDTDFNPATEGNATRFNR